MAFVSPHPPIIVPDVSYVDHLLGQFDSFGTRTAVIDGQTGASIAFDELSQRVREAAACFATRGIGRGHVVGILSANDCLYPVAVYGALLAGASVTPISPQSTRPELERQLELSGARTLIVANDLIDTGAAEAAGVERYFTLPPCDEFPSLEASCSGLPRSPVWSGDPSSDIALLPFSSGTTGLPKGVALSHRNLVANLEQLNVMDDLTGCDTTLAILPFFHIYGLTFALGHSLFHGASVVILARFEPNLFLDALETHNVTRAPLAPPLIAFLANSPLVNGRDLSRLSVLMTGAAALDPATSRACADRLGVVIRQGYGMTETTSVTHINWSDPARVLEGTIGVLAPNTEARIVDPEDLQDCGIDEVGELWVRGPQIMSGYFQNEAATVETITQEKWLKTGDLASADENGQFRIVGRLKELIKYRGHQVPPGELEEVILALPGVSDAAVVGQPHPEFGELPIAFIVADDLAEEDVISQVSDRVSPYKKLRGVRFVETIPRSASGKILRCELVHRLTAEFEGEAQ